MADSSNNAGSQSGSKQQDPNTAAKDSRRQAAERDAPGEDREATTRKDWFHKCCVKKEKTLKKLYVLKNGVARRFTSVEYDAWKPSFNSFANSCGFPGLLMVATKIIKFDKHNRLINLPTEDGGDLEDTAHSVQQKRYILKVIADIAGIYIGMPSSDKIDALPEEDINFHFRGLLRFLAEVSYHVVGACEVSDTDECVYPELSEIPGNITVLKNGMPHPTQAFMQLSWIDTQVSIDPSGTGMHQREQLEQDLLALQEDRTLVLHSFKRLLDDLKQKVVSIQNRDPGQSHSTNESAQEKFSDAIKVACRRIERESTDAKQQKAAELIRMGLLRMDELVAKPAIHDFHVQVSHLLNRFVPPNADVPVECETQEPKLKRTKTTMESGDSLALLVKGLPGHLALQVLKHAYNIPGEIDADTAKKNGPHHQRNKVPKKSRPAWWMCKNCCELGHDESDCTNDPDPDSESKFEDHLAKCRADQAKRAQRKQAHARHMQDKDAMSIADRKHRNTRKDDTQLSDSEHQANACRQTTNFPFRSIDNQ